MSVRKMKTLVLIASYIWLFPSIVGNPVAKEHNMDWVSYHSLEDIYGWLDYLVKEHPFCSIETFDEKTPEGQNMKVMKVSFELKTVTVNSHRILRCVKVAVETSQLFG